MMTNFHLNTTAVAIFPNVCLWRRSLCSDLVLTLKNRIEPPSYARTAYLLQYGPHFVSTLSEKFGQLVRFFWANGLPPPLAKNFPNAYGYHQGQYWMPVFDLWSTVLHDLFCGCLIFPIGGYFFCIFREPIFAIVKDWFFLLGTNFLGFSGCYFNWNYNIFVFFKRQVKQHAKI